MNACISSNEFVLIVPFGNKYIEKETYEETNANTYKDLRPVPKACSCPFTSYHYSFIGIAINDYYY